MAKKISAQLAAKLRNAREKFKKAQPAESNAVANRKVLDGVYTAKVVGLEFDEFGKHPILRFTFEITDADKKVGEASIGELVESRFNLDTDEGPSFIKRDFQKFGYDDVDDLLDDVEQSSELFEELLGLHPLVKIMVQMDETDQWQNVYLNDVLEMDEEDDSEETEGEDEEEEDSEVDVEEESGEDGTEEEEDGIEEDDEDYAELEEGDLVEVTYNKKQQIGTVVSVDDENETVKVKLSKTKKTVLVPLDVVYVLEG